MQSRLTGKTALVTGAAQGIGRAIAELFADEGASVLLTDINDELGREVTSTIPSARYLRLDVRLEEEWQETMRRLRGEGVLLDILINNAGITGFQEGFGSHDPEHATLQDWRKVHETNLDGTFLGCKYAIEAMKTRGGSIVNISSRSGLVGIPGAAAYASSKAGVRNHTKTVALYCAAQGYPIRCNSIHPAAISTPMWGCDARPRRDARKTDPRNRQGVSVAENGRPCRCGGSRALPRLRCLQVCHGNRAQCRRRAFGRIGRNSEESGRADGAMSSGSGSYGKLCTEFYDLDKPHPCPEGLKYYRAAAERSIGPILEPMCGSGRYLIPLMEQGFSIAGFDNSEAMLRACRKKCLTKGLYPDVVKADFKTAGILFAKEYGLIFIPDGWVSSDGGGRARTSAFIPIRPACGRRRIPLRDRDTGVCSRASEIGTVP